MKKVILVLVGLLSVFTLTGCQEKVELNLSEISTKLENLSDGNFNMQGVNFEQLGVYGTMTGIYEYEFMEIFNLEPSLIEGYNVNYNKESKELLAIFKPVEGKIDEVKSVMSNFIDESVLLTEHQGHLIYISSSNNELVANEVIKSETLIFNNMVDVPLETIEGVLGVKPEDVTEFSMKLPMMSISSSMYIIAKPAEGKEELVKEQLDTYVTNLETQGAAYLPQQLELVKNRKVEQLGEYLIYIISNDNELVFNTIKG